MCKRRMEFAALPVLCGLSVIAAFALAPTASMAASVITPANLAANNWSFVDRGPVGGYEPGTNPSGVGQLVNGPASPPLGTGSAELKTDNSVSTVTGQELRNTGYAGTRLDAITALTYWAYDVSNNGNLVTNQFPYLTVSVSTTGGLVADDYIAFEPPYQSPPTHNAAITDQAAPAFDTWQMWDALAGGWWSQNGNAGCNPGSSVCPLSDYLAAFPNATLANETTGGGATLGAIRLAVGYTSGPLDVLEGYVDALTIGINGVDTTYDFEAGAPVPLPSALPLFATGLGALGYLGWRRKRKAAAALAA